MVCTAWKLYAQVFVIHAVRISPAIFAFDLPSTRNPLNLSNAPLKFPSWIADSSFRAACNVGSLQRHLYRLTNV